MSNTIFLTIIKWWCNCLDLCFETVARPWKPEELHYRRMIGTIFDQPWKIPKSFDMFDTENIPTTYRETRARLTLFTRAFWTLNVVRNQMTPVWSEGTVQYLEGKFDELFRELGERFSQPTILAFRMENQVGELHVGSRFLGEAVGVESVVLRRDLNNLKYYLQNSDKAGFLAPFAFQERAYEAWQIVINWKNDRRRIAREAFLTGNPEETDRILNTSVEELELSVRTYNCLKDAGCITVRDILEKSKAELLRIKRFGHKQLNEIRDVLKGIDPLLEIGLLAEKDQTD